MKGYDLGKDRSLKRRSFSVFVDNLPHNIDSYGLKGIFRKARNVCDSYIPSKLGRTGKRLGFVTFWNEGDVVKSIKLFNRSIIRGSRIKVCRVKFDGGEVVSRGKVAFKQLWVPKKK